MVGGAEGISDTCEVVDPVIDSGAGRANGVAEDGFDMIFIFLGKAGYFSCLGYIRGFHDSKGAVWRQAVLVVDFCSRKIVDLRDHELVWQLCFGLEAGCATFAELL